jgi:hypothetical protein
MCVCVCVCGVMFIKQMYVGRILIHSLERYVVWLVNYWDNSERQVVLVVYRSDVNVTCDIFNIIHILLYCSTVNFNKKLYRVQ